MLELYVVKATCTVPRRERGSNPSDLADKETCTVLRGERSRKASDLPDISSIYRKFWIHISHNINVTKSYILNSINFMLCI